MLFGGTETEEVRPSGGGAGTTNGDGNYCLNEWMNERREMEGGSKWDERRMKNQNTHI
jgi:hypothetical protein